MVEPGTLPDGTVATTPVVPVIVGDDWQAVLLWKALFDAGVYTNVAIHPAVPPGGALLRTSLMATHEREHLDGALATIGQVIAEFPDLAAAPGRAIALLASGQRIFRSRFILGDRVLSPTGGVSACTKRTRSAREKKVLLATARRQFRRPG